MTGTLETEPSWGRPTTGGLRFVAVRGNLLPAEVLSARAAEETRRRVLLALGALVAIVALVFAAAWWQTHRADNELSAQQRRAAALQSRTTTFAPLIEAQQATTSVHDQLARLMVGDLSWQHLLASLQALAPRGVALSQVSGSLTTGLGAGSATNPPAGTLPAAVGLPAAGVASIGSLTIVGTARDKDAVADYTDALSRVTGLSTPFVNSVLAGTPGVTFNLTVPITAAAAGGRYATAAGGRYVTAAGDSTTGGH